MSNTEKIHKDDDFNEEGYDNWMYINERRTTSDIQSKFLCDDSSDEIFVINDYDEHFGPQLEENQMEKNENLASKQENCDDSGDLVEYMEDEQSLYGREIRHKRDLAFDEKMPANGKPTFCSHTARDMDCAFCTVKFRNMAVNPSIEVPSPLQCNCGPTVKSTTKPILKPTVPRTRGIIQSTTKSTKKSATQHKKEKHSEDEDIKKLFLKYRLENVRDQNKILNIGLILFTIILIWVPVFAPNNYSPNMEEFKKLKNSTNVQINSLFEKILQLEQQIILLEETIADIGKAENLTSAAWFNSFNVANAEDGQNDNNEDTIPIAENYITHKQIIEMTYFTVATITFIAFSFLILTFLKEEATYKMRYRTVRRKRQGRSSVTSADQSCE